MNAPRAISLPGDPVTAGSTAPAGLAQQTADSTGTNGRLLAIRAKYRSVRWSRDRLADVFYRRRRSFQDGVRNLLLACLLGVCTGAIANDGQLILVSGEVTLQRSLAGQPAQSLTPVTGSRVHGGDALVTGASGRVQIRFSDGSLLSLQPKSEFRIDEYRFDMSGQRGFFSLMRGALRTISGAIGKRDPDDYRMTTPTATIGIRGTEFVVEETACTPACHPGRIAGLRVAVSAGRVVVFNPAGSIEIAAGEAAYVSGPGSAPVPSSSDRR